MINNFLVDKNMNSVWDLHGIDLTYVFSCDKAALVGPLSFPFSLPFSLPKRVGNWNFGNRKWKLETEIVIGNYKS